ncbi:hypothetical protein [Yunchengibacter salinarum]|uniref:hypothetical protein n=1 Tax=Yunchengibacter salinarum TaxID=3133399 RepID=UPI0035B652CF
MSKAEMDFTPRPLDAENPRDSTREDPQAEGGTATDHDRREEASSGSGRRYRSVGLAALLSLFWLGGAGFVLWQRGLTSIAEMSPATLASLTAGVATPLAVIWLVTLAFQRTDPLLERRLAMSRTLHKAMAPVEQAELRLDMLTRSLEKEISNVEAVSALAMERIENLENRFQTQISNLFSATADTEARTASITDSISRERDQLGATTEDMERRFETIEETISRVAQSIHDAGEDAQQRGNALQDRIGGAVLQLETAGATLDGRIEQATSLLDSRGDRLDQVGSDIALRLESLTEALSTGMDRMKSGVSDLEGRSAELSDHMRAQGQVLHELATLSASESTKINESLAKHVDQVKAAAEQALSATDEVSALLARKTGDLTEDVLKAVEKARGLILEAGETFDTHSREVVQVSRDVHEATRTHADDTGRILQERTTEMDRFLEERLAHARTTLEETANTMSSQSHDALAQVEHAAESAEKRLKAMIQAVSGDIEGLSDTANAQGEKIGRISVDMEDRADSLTAKTEAVRTDMAAARKDFDQHQRALAEHLADTRQKLARLEDDLANQRSQLGQTASDAAQRVNESLTRFEDMIRQVDEASGTAAGHVGEEADRMANRIEDLNREGRYTRDSLTAAVDGLSGQAAALKTDLTQASRSLGAAADAFAGERQRITSETEAVITRLGGASDRMGGRIDQFHASSMEAADRMDAASTHLMDESAKVRAAMEATVTDTRTDLHSALQEITDQASQQITVLQEQIEATLARLLGEYTETTERAEREGAWLASRLGNEAAKIAERADTFLQQTAEIEERITRSSQNDFSRTSQLLMESLENASIDITRALSNNVGAELWDAYRGGDRGVFARKTLQLADRRTRRAIAAKVAEDRDFKEVVSRFMRDFESLMERGMIGDRGGALATTLLSSDMGRLYVMLAQALKKFS